MTKEEKRDKLDFCIRVISKLVFEYYSLLFDLYQTYGEILPKQEVIDLIESDLNVYGQDSEFKFKVHLEQTDSFKWMKAVITMQIGDKEYFVVDGSLPNVCEEFWGD